MIRCIIKIRKITLSICFILFLSNSTFLFSQPQYITTPLNEGVTSERDFSYYNRLYSEFNLNQSVDSNLTLLSHLGIGPCYDAVPRDNYLFIGNGALFQVLDISNPENPFVIGEVLTEKGNISDIELYGDYAIFVYPFTVINIANPTNPFIVYSGSYGMSELYLDDHYAFTDVPSGVRIIDIETPEIPQVLSTANTYNDIITGMVVKNNYLYISDIYFLTIYDISDKSNPLYIDSFGGGWADLYIRDNYLFNAGIFFFEVYDISDPADIVYLNGVELEGFTVDMTVADSTAFITLGNNGNGMGINILDISNPMDLPEPKYYNTINSIFGYVRCNVKGDKAYISSGVGFDIYNILGRDSILYLSNYLTGNSVYKMKIYNDYLFCSIFGGIKIIDYSDPYDLKIIGQYQEKIEIRDFDFSGNYLYLMTDHSINILNISNPKLPVKTNEIFFSDTLASTAVGSITIKDSLMIVSLPVNYLTLINIEDPTYPFIIDSIPSGNRIHDLEIRDDYLFSSEGFDGFKIYKLTTPPYEIYSVDSVSFALQIENDLLFIHYEVNLSIYNISSLNNPIFIGSTRISGGGNRLEISKSGNFVNTATNQNLEILDVSDPTNPFIAAYSRNEPYYSVASINNLIFAGNGNRGIKVFKNDLINSVSNESYNISIDKNYLYQNYPNPFNSTTSIKYRLTESANIKLKLYDILGNEIKTLDDGWRTSGEYTVEISTDKLTTGVYFYQLISDKNIVTKKFLLLK